MHRILSYAATAAVILLTSTASADPTLTLSTTEIQFSPTMTVISFTVDPNDTPLSAVVLNFSALASGLEIVAVTPTDVQIAGSGPMLNGGDWEGGFVGAFATDRTLPFEVGTLTLEGFVADTPLVLTGNYTDGSFNDIPIGPVDVAFVIPEPAMATVELTALAVILGLYRSRHRGMPFSRARATG